MSDLDKVIKENISLVELTSKLMHDLMFTEMQLDQTCTQLALLEKYQLEQEGTLVVN